MKKYESSYKPAIFGLMILAGMFLWMFSENAKGDTKDSPFIIIHDQFWQLMDTSEAHCLALNIYHESRSDNLAGQYAVADVVLNRVENKRYPNTVCDVVYQGKMKPSWKDPEKMIPIRNMCQFSWYCEGKDYTPHEL